MTGLFLGLKFQPTVGYLGFVGLDSKSAGGISGWKFMGLHPRLGTLDSSRVYYAWPAQDLKFSDVPAGCFASLEVVMVEVLAINHDLSSFAVTYGPFGVTNHETSFS